MLKLKLQYSDHLMQRADSLGKIRMPEKIEGRRRRGVTEDEMAGCHYQLSGHEFMNSSKPREIAEDRGTLRAAVHGVTRSRTGLSD